MKLTDFFKINEKKNEAEGVVSPPEPTVFTDDSGSEKAETLGQNFEKNSEKNLENGPQTHENKTPETGQNHIKNEPQTVDELLNNLQNVGKELQQPGQPDMSDIPNALKKEDKTTEPPTGKNVRDAKALIEINDWGLGFGLSKYAKEPGENITEAMEPYQASEDEKEDLTADLAELLQDSGIELPPGVKFAFTYLRVYGPKAFLAHVNRRMYIKMEKEFERQKAQMREEMEAMKQQFRADMEKEYKGKFNKPNVNQEPFIQETPIPPEPTQEQEDFEPEFESTTIENDGSVVYEPAKVAKSYDQFRVKTDWEEPDTPANLKNAPYAISLQGTIYEMIGELKRGEKIILDILRDGFTQDLKPIQTLFEIPDKGLNGRKSTYERALLETIYQIQKELKETAKKITILKNSV
jgi:hypothetical protein